VTKLLLVEDERELGSVLTRHLEGEGFEVRLVTDGREALDRMAREVYDLIVLDVMLPGIDGLEVARILRSTPSGSSGTRSSVPILMLTARAEESDRVLGLEVGADDYLTKPFGLRELVARVRAMLRRVQLLRETLEFSREPVQIGAIEIDPEARAVRVDGHVTDLTPREYDLLLMLARQPGRTFSRDYLLEHIWGPAYEGSDRVVDTTVVRLRRKLSVEGERVVSVWGVGYRLES
jgi:two-component system phosphate regulon response regulator PhoB